jgi:DNA recombination protein RmuC
MEFTILIIAVVILLIAVFLFIKKPKSTSGLDIETYNTLKTELAVSEQKVRSAKEEKQDNENSFSQRIKRLEAEKNDLIEQLTNEKKKLSRAEEAFNAQKERFQEQRAFVEESQIRFKTEFENVANQVLKAKTAEFTEVNKTT